MPAKRQPALPIVLASVTMTREERIAALRRRDTTVGQDNFTAVQENVGIAGTGVSVGRHKVIHGAGWIGTAGASPFKPTDWSALA